jgi:DNA replication protein DnaC
MKRKVQPERVASVTRELLIASGVPERFWTAQITDVTGRPKYKDVITRYVRDIDVNANGGKGLRILGGFNTGKTSLAVIAMKEVIQRGGVAHFLEAKDIPRVFYDGMLVELPDYTEITVAERLRRCNLIVLDDLGAEGFDPKGAAGAEIERVLRDAYSSLTAVIVTMNFPDEGELEKRYTPAVVSLLRRITYRLVVKTDQWKV